ncbi:MAG: hydrolase [Proteobacteria bacterium]|nr:MAG: hydrolase [Pseudomonadota bacterium]
MLQKYKCPCCGFFTLDDAPGNFDICPVCVWEDDNVQRDLPDFRGGANVVSLNEARRNYLDFGCSDRNHLAMARPPGDEEKK